MRPFRMISGALLGSVLVCCSVGGSVGSPPAAAEPGSSEEVTVVDVAGKVVRVGQEWWGLVPDDEPGTRYAPDNLDESFHEDGLAVVFSGEVGEIPPGARMWGTPFHITEIAVREE